MTEMQNYLLAFERVAVVETDLQKAAEPECRRSFLSNP